MNMTSVLVSIFVLFSGNAFAETDPVIKMAKQSKCVNELTHELMSVTTDSLHTSDLLLEMMQPLLRLEQGEAAAKPQGPRRFINSKESAESLARQNELLKEKTRLLLERYNLCAKSEIEETN